MKTWIIRNTTTWFSNGIKIVWTRWFYVKKKLNSERFIELWFTVWRTWNWTVNVHSVQFSRVVELLITPIYYELMSTCKHFTLQFRHTYPKYSRVSKLISKIEHLNVIIKTISFSWIYIYVCIYTHDAIIYFYILNV